MNNILSTTDIRTEYMTLIDLFEKLRLMRSSPTSSRHRMKDTDSIRDASRMVEVVLLGIPIVPVYIDGSQRQWRIIKGEERLLMLWDYVNNAFALHGTRFMIDTLEERFFDEIPMSLRDKLLYITIPVCLLNPGISNYARYSIYQYLHTPSSPLERLNDIKQILPESFVILYDKCQKTLFHMQRQYQSRLSMVFNIYCYMALSCRLEHMKVWQKTEHIDSLMIEALEDVEWLQRLPEVSMDFVNLIASKSGVSRRNLFVAVLARDGQLLRIYNFNELNLRFDDAWLRMMRSSGAFKGESCEEYNNKIEYVIQYMRR